MPKKLSSFESMINAEINKREARLNGMLNDKVKIMAELEGLKKSREIYIQSKKRAKIINVRGEKVDV